jgi:iron complex transport system ATP-binding protein
MQQDALAGARPTSPEPEALAELDDAAVRTADAVLLRGVSLRIRAGEHWAVLGPNGAGKTTLLSLLAGRRQPSSGRVHLLGHEMGRVDVRTLWPRLAIVGHTVSDRVPPHTRAVDVVRTGNTGALSPWWQGAERDTLEPALELLRRLGCEALADRPLGSCSQGERQRILIARALAGQPDLLLLDEPAAGLDMPGREALLASLEHAAAPTNAEPRALAATSVLVTHHLEEIPTTTTHAVLLSGGRVVAAGALDAVLTPELLRECFGLPVQVRRVDGRWSARAEPGWLHS